MLVNMTLLIRWLLLACALVLLTQWDLGVQVDNFGAAMWAASTTAKVAARGRPTPAKESHSSSSEAGASARWAPLAATW